MEYIVNEELQQRIGSKRVQCLDDNCSFESTLAEYVAQHEHGKAAYSNAHVDFEYLRPCLIRPMSASRDPASNILSTSIRSQLLQVMSVSISFYSALSHIASMY